MNETRLLYDIEEVATMVGLGRTRLYEEIRSGRLRSVKVGRRRLVPLAAVERWVDQLDPGSL